MDKKDTTAETCPEFCGEYGHNTDSIKAKSTWEQALEQFSKLQRIFTEEEAESFPS